MSDLSKYLTPGLISIFEIEVVRLKTELRTNYMEILSLRSINIKQAWQEERNVCIAPNISALLVDYIRDGLTGEIDTGSDSETIYFDEFWTFIRPPGSNSHWVLTTIERA